jgi:hypothetical protein
LLVESSALARDIYLNGTKVQGIGLTNQVFDRCKVRFDHQGNVHIEVEGVNVQVVQTEGRPGIAAPVPVPSGRLLQHRYFIEASQARIGFAQFDVEVHVNGKSAALFRGDRPQGAVEVTNLLHPGENKLLFIANKSGGARRSTSRRDFIKVSLARGTVQGDNVLINAVIRSFERTAADSSSTAEEHRVRVD